MATDNRSPSYLAEREYVRKWLQKTKAGQTAVDILKRSSSLRDMQAVLDDENFTDWEELVRDYRDAPLLAASCAEARGAYDLARQSTTKMGPPAYGKAKWRNFFSAPTAYVLRRQIETNDPDYWNDPQNVYREAMRFPEWSKVPDAEIRARLESFLPRGKKIIAAA